MAPDIPEQRDRVARGADTSVEFGPRLGGEGSRRDPFVNAPPGMPDVPLVFVGLQVEELQVRQRFEVNRASLGRTVRHLEDAPIVAMNVFVVVAFAGIGPVGHVDAAIVSVHDGRPTEPGVLRADHIGSAAADVAHRRADEQVVVDPPSMDVAHENAAAITLGPVIAEVDHRARVGVATTGIVVNFPGARFLPGPAAPVEMFGNRGKQRVGVRIDVLPEHPLVVGTGHHMPEVGDDAVRGEQLAVLVEIDPPGIRRAPTERLERAAGGVIAPDTAVEQRALVVGSAGLGGERIGEDAVGTVEPAIGPPGEGRGDVVLGFEVPAIKELDGGAIGGVVLVGIGNEQEVRGGHHVDTAKPDLHAGDVGEVVGEDLPLVATAVAVGIGEDHDAILAGFFPLGVGEAFGDPDPAAIIGRHGDWLDDIGLAGEEGRLKPFGDEHRPCGFVRREGFIRLLCQSQSRPQSQPHQNQGRDAEGEWGDTRRGPMRCGHSRHSCRPVRGKAPGTRRSLWLRR